MARADIGAEQVPVPGQLLVPLPTQGDRGRGNPPWGGQATGNGPYVALDGKQLDALLNPAPCPAPGRR